MANIKSAKKRMVQSRKRRLRNKENVSKVRTEIKKLLVLLNTSTDVTILLTALRKVEKLIDKVASKGVIHKNKAARTKSRLTRRYNKVIGNIRTDTVISTPLDEPSSESELEHTSASVTTAVTE